MQRRASINSFIQLEESDPRLRQPFQNSPRNRSAATSDRQQSRVSPNPALARRFQYGRSGYLRPANNEEPIDRSVTNGRRHFWLVDIVAFDQNNVVPTTDIVEKHTTRLPPRQVIWQRYHEV